MRATHVGTHHAAQANATREAIITREVAKLTGTHLKRR